MIAAVKAAPVSKSLNDLNISNVIYLMLSTIRLSFSDYGCVFGTTQELATKLAFLSLHLGSDSDNQLNLLDSATTSFLCRKMDEQRNVAYGNKLHYRDGLSNFKEVTVSGHLVKRGGKLMLVVGNLFLHLDEADLTSKINPSFSLDDFLWTNRPYSTKLTKSKGVLQFTLRQENENGKIKIEGFKMPVISEHDSRPLIINGVSHKTQAKKELDLLKRRKNMYLSSF